MRGTGTVAPQALYLMNNPFPIEQGRVSGAKLLKRDLPTDDARIDAAYRSALGRLPTQAERGVLRKFVAAQNSAPEAWAAVFHSLFASAEFRYAR